MEGNSFTQVQGGSHPQKVTVILTQMEQPGSRGLGLKAHLRGKSPRSRHFSSNPQTPGTLPDAYGTSLVKSPPPETSAGPPSTDESNGPSSPIPRTPPLGLLTQALASFCKPGPGPAPISPRKQHPRALRDSPEHAGSSHHCLSPLPFGAQPLVQTLLHRPADPYISTLASEFLLLGAPE